MKRIVFVLASIVLLSFSVAAEVSSDLQNELDQLGPNDRVEVLVQTGPSMTDRHVNAMSQQGELKNRYNLFDGVHLELPVPAVEALSRLEFVESVEPNYEIELFLSESASQVEADTVWEYQSTGEGVETAVLDTGVHSEHSELNIIQQMDFTGEGFGDNNGHGTHVAGIIGSQDENNRGLAYESNLYDVKVLNQDGHGSGSDLLEGMEWTVNNDMQIAVMSLGAEVENCDGEDILSQAVNEMTDQGVFVTVAAGNNGPEDRTITVPGCSSKGTTVGSVDKNDKLADYSSRGPTADGRAKPDVVAPGTGIESTWNNGGFNTISGTSMATPHVAGQAALLLGEDNSLGPNELKDIITDTSTDLGLDSNQQGHGRINVSEAYFQVSDEEREQEEEEDEETKEETDEETQEYREEDDLSSDQEQSGTNTKAEGRIRLGPDSMFYGLRIASDRAAVSLGFRTREDVMERRAREARQMQERGDSQSAERALNEMRKTAGDSENANRELEETLERVMEGSPEESKEGLRNALRNVEQRTSSGDQSRQRNEHETREQPGEQKPERESLREQQRDESIQDSEPAERRSEETEQSDRGETTPESEEEQSREDTDELQERENSSEDLQQQQDQRTENRQESNLSRNQGQDRSSDGIGQFFKNRLEILE